MEVAAERTREEGGCLDVPVYHLAHNQTSTSVFLRLLGVSLNPAWELSQNFLK